MASLTIRNIPDPVIGRLRETAEEQKRSVNQQALVWLEDGARSWPNQQESRQLFERIRRRRKRIEAHGGVDADKLIRRMRTDRLRVLRGNASPTNRH